MWDQGQGGEKGIRVRVFVICFYWREERQMERESWACWHWERLRAVPLLEQRERTASDSDGHATDTRQLARARFRCRHEMSRSCRWPKRRWQSRSACSRWSHVATDASSRSDIFLSSSSSLLSLASDGSLELDEVTRSRSRRELLAGSDARRKS